MVVRGGAVQAVQVEFRKRFVAAVQPKNLPASWTVHHEAPREFGTHSIFSEQPLEDPPPQVFATARQQRQPTATKPPRQAPES